MKTYTNFLPLILVACGVVSHGGAFASCADVFVVRKAKASKNYVKRLAPQYRRLLVPKEERQRVFYRARFEDEAAEIPSVIWGIDRPSSRWSTLSGIEKRFLVGELAMSLNQGIYDNSITIKNRILEGQLFPETMISHKTGKPDPEANDLKFIPNNLFDQTLVSPQKYLQSAKEGKLSGICRHAASGLAALLIEAGASASDLNIFTDSKIERNMIHTVLGVRIEGEWFIWDPTPAGTKFPVMEMGQLVNAPEYYDFAPLTGEFVIEP